MLKKVKKRKLMQSIFQKGMAFLLCMSLLTSNLNGFSVYAMENTSIQTEDETESPEEIRTTEAGSPSGTQTIEQDVSETEEIQTSETGQEVSEDASEAPVTEATSSEESSEADTSENSAQTYMERAYALLSAKGLNAAFEGGSVGPDKFILDKAGTITEIPESWTGLALGSLYDNDGKILTSLFPKIEGYHIVRATVHDGPIRQLGMLTQKNGEQTETFIYYSSSDEPDMESVTVLEEDDKITLYYELDEYEITYQLTGDTEGVSLDSVFGRKRPTKTSNHDFSLDVTIPRGYTGFVYVNNSSIKPDDNYNSFMLGDEPIYKASSKGAEIDTSKFPNYYSSSGHYTVRNATRKQSVSVMLTKRGDFLKDDYKFDPHFWLENNNIKSRIKAANRGVQTFKGTTENNTYSFDWYFEIEVIPNEWKTYMLQSLEINGESVGVPFYDNSVGFPYNSVETTLSTGTRITVTLTQVRLDDLSVTARVPAYRRVYWLHAENAAENLIITDGSLTTALPFQNVLRKADGLDVQYWIYKGNNKSEWVDKKLGDIIIVSVGTTFFAKPDTFLYGQYGKSGQFQGNVRFKPHDGFNAPTSYLYRNSAGKKVTDGLVQGPDAEGWYYIKLTNPSGNRFTSLYLQGVPKNYVVRYLPGTPDSGEVIDMPTFNNGDVILAQQNTDANGGAYYQYNGSTNGSKTMIDIASAPKNVAGQNQSIPFVADTFLSWSVATDDSGTPAKNDKDEEVSLAADSRATLEDLAKYAVYDSTNNVYVIYLVPHWQNNSFRYFVNFEWSTPGGTQMQAIRMQKDARQFAVNSGAQRKDESLRVVVKSDADFVKAWLAEHPGYVLSKKNQYVQEVKNRGKITIQFEQVPAKLEVTKELVDENKDLQQSSRDFPMTLTLTYPEGAVDVEGHSLEGQKLNSDYNGTYSYTVKKKGDSESQTGEKKTLEIVNGQGTFTLKSGETAVFEDLPDGTVYDIKENTPEGFTAEYENKTETLSKDKASSVTVTNRKTVDLTIRKVVAGDAADKDKEWNFTVTLTDGEDTETEDFTLKNGQSQLIQGWPAGTTYTITEAEAGKDGYRTIISGAEDQGNGKAAGTLRHAEAENGITVTYTNTNHAGNLIINKVVGGNGGDAGREFEFHLELTDPDDETLKDNYTYVDESGQEHELQFTDEGDHKKSADFKLKHGQTIIIMNLPTDTGYTVTEQPVTGITPGYSVYWYRKGDKEQKAGNTVSGKFLRTEAEDAEDINITFANVREVDNALTISKRVENGREKEPTEAQKQETFTFTITLEHPSLGDSYTYINAEDKREPLKLTKDGNKGTATVTLRHDQYITIEGLPSGTAYTVTETPKAGYTVATAGKSSGVLSDDPVRIDFINQVHTYDLTVSKKVIGTPVVSGQAFTAAITLTDADGNPVTGQYAYDGAEAGMMGSTGTVTLKDGEAITIHGLPADTKYNVTEEETEGYTVSYPKGTEGVIQDTPVTVEIRNTVNTGSTLAVINQVEGSDPGGRAFDIRIALNRPDGTPLDGTYTYTTGAGESGTITNGLGTVSLKKGETVTVAGLPYGAGYRVAGIPTDGYTVQYASGNSGTLKDGKEQVTVIHTPVPVHNLVITKRTEGTGADEKDSFTFTVDLAVPEGSAVDAGQFTYTGPNGTTNGVLKYTEDGWTASPEIRLLSGQSVTISGLPEGTEYAVTENEADQNGYSTVSEQNLGVIGMEDAAATFTNTRRTALTIGKLVSGVNAPTDRVFTFQVVLTPPEGVALADSYPFTGMDAEGHTDASLTLADGKNGTKIGTVRLKHEQGITILDLPAGTGYVVTESGNEGFETVARDAAGTLEADKDGYARTALFVNTWLQPVSLTVRKVTTGDLAEDTKEWNFEVQLKAPEGVTLADSYSYTDEEGRNHILNLNGQGTDRTGKLVLQSGGSATILGLPVGTTYTVTEAEADRDGYTTTITGADTVADGSAGGTLSQDQIQSGAVITFINAFSSGNLIITKETAGAGSNRYRDFNFTLSLVAPDGVTLEDTYACTDAGGRNYILELTDKGNGKEGAFKLKHGGTFIIEGLPAGTEYTITEQPVSGITPAYSTSYTVNGGTEQTGRQVHGQITADAEGIADNVSVTFINKREVANTLTITKQVTGVGGEKDRYFDFTVTLRDPEGNALTESFLYTGSAFGTVADGDTVSLKDGDSITIEGLPEGTQYAIREEETEGYTVEATGSAGTITENTEADFVNARVAAPLTITKRQLVNDVEAGARATVTGGDTITYELTIANTGSVAAADLTVTDAIPSGLILVEGSVTHLGMQEDGVITWTFPQLDAGQEITVSFAVTVPPVTESMVWENTASVRYGNAVPDPDMPDIGQPVTSNAVIAVAHPDGEAHTGSLTVSKTVAGSGAEKDRPFTFTITLTDENGTELTDQFVYTGSDVDTLQSGDTVVLRHGEHITIEGLPEGTNYIVLEEQTEDYTVTADGAAGTIIDQTESTADFINVRRTASLTLSKRQLVNKKAADDLVIVKAGDTITYELTVENTGDVKAAGVVVTDQIPSGLQLVEDSVSDGGTVTGGIVTWILPDLAGGEGKTVSFTVTVPPVLESTVWENTAEADYENAPVSPETSEQMTIRSNMVTAAAHPESVVETGILAISKTVTGTGGERDRAFTFTVTFMDEDGNVLAGSFPYVGSREGMIRSGETVSLCHGERITISNLPAGTRYTVTESEAEGYTVTMSGEAGTIETDTITEAAFENHKDAVIPPDEPGTDDTTASPDEPGTDDTAASPDEPGTDDTAASPDKPKTGDTAAPPDKPKTGDTAAPAVWLMFMMLSLSGFCMVYQGRKRERDKK